MFFGNEKINRKSCSEEKKVRGKTVYFYGLESGLGNARRKTFRVARRFIGRRERFWKIFGGFYNFFYNFLENFYNFFRIFCNFFGKFSQNFLQFFSTFAISLRFFPKIFPKILAHNPLRFGRVQPGFNRGLAIIVSLQLSLHLSLHPYL